MFSSIIKTIMLTIVLVTIVWYFFLPKHLSSFSYTSPLPDFLTLGKNHQVTLLDLWAPFVGQTRGGEFDPSTITAKSALLYDLETNKSLFEKNPRSRLPMASLTKIMTAIITLENPRSDDRYIVQGSSLVGEDSMGLTSGEVLTREELLYGLMLPSGNDAAEVLASNSPFGRNQFIVAMNNKARALGLTDTRFSNPSGLQGDGVQYTTAYDLLVITRYALENFPIFTQIVSTPEYFISERSTHKAYYLLNETNLLTTYDGVKGVKTGYTPEAGLCLVTYLEYKGHKIIGVLLNSENRRSEMRQLLDYSLKSLKIDPPEYRGG